MSRHQSANERRRKEIFFSYRWGYIAALAAERGIDPEELVLTPEDRTAIRETFVKFVELSSFDIQIAGIPPGRERTTPSHRSRP